MHYCMQKMPKICKNRSETNFIGIFSGNILKIYKLPGPNKNVLCGFFLKINKRPETFIRHSRVVGFL